MRLKSRLFTGLVSELGIMVSLRKVAAGGALTVSAPEAASSSSVGDSIAVSGVCLTVTDIKGADVTFDLSGETLRSTILGGLKPGAKVNIELSLRADGKLGGHFVTGHVDAVGGIRRKERDGETWVFEIEAPPEVLGLLVDKGSVAVDGISLTVVKVLENSFTLVIIPHTLGMTTLGFKERGDRVNLEADIIGKYVHRFIAGGRNGRGDDSLKGALLRSGFIGA